MKKTCKRRNATIKQYHMSKSEYWHSCDSAVGTKPAQLKVITAMSLFCITAILLSYNSSVNKKLTDIK